MERVLTNRFIFESPVRFLSLLFIANLNDSAVLIYALRTNTGVPVEPNAPIRWFAFLKAV